jgi:hypothetical protein
LAWLGFLLEIKRLGLIWLFWCGLGLAWNIFFIKRLGLACILKIPDLVTPTEFHTYTDIDIVDQL